MDKVQGVPHLCGFHWRNFWLMYILYMQGGDFRVSRGPPTVPLTWILHNAFLFKSQNPHKVGILLVVMFECGTWSSNFERYLIVSLFRPTYLKFSGENSWNWTAAFRLDLCLEQIFEGSSQPWLHLLSRVLWNVIPWMYEGIF